MSVGGLSAARLGRLRDVMAGYVERGEVPGYIFATFCTSGEKSAISWT
jgi:hypothetical protein